MELNIKSYNICAIDLYCKKLASCLENHSEQQYLHFGQRQRQLYGMVDGRQRRMEQRRMEF
ncbi:hypothetical protein C1645_840702 [Glomus cerebriforme]|uniref:Uncharacterized protein n=1 Tax=Glomus cerebriforme TaxID=658196 RepID=A0A397S1P9_9GLOM|nr:hypothetical protein C1645_840702 [Glomus cerebriforme]